MSHPDPNLQSGERDKLRHDIERAADAQRLQHDAFLTTVLAEVEEKAVKEWRAASTPAEREALHARVVGLDEIRKHLRVLADRGKSAADTLKRHNAAASR